MPQNDSPKVRIRNCTDTIEFGSARLTCQLPKEADGSTHTHAHEGFIFSAIGSTTEFTVTWRHIGKRSYIAKQSKQTP